jgi:hypothetical protein
LSLRNELLVLKLLLVLRGCLLSFSLCVWDVLRHAYRSVGRADTFDLVTLLLR